MVPALATTRRGAPSRAPHRAAQAVPGEPRPQLRELVATGSGPDSMSSTPSNCARGSAREGRGAARRARTARPPCARRSATAATSCCASTSSGFWGCASPRPRRPASPRDGGAGQQVAAVLREDDAARDRLHLVAGPADALHAARHRGRRLDLDHEVDRAHVDPQLERRGGDHRGQPARLERVLDLHALLAGDRAVVRAGQLLAGQLVEGGGHALGQAAAVHEDEGRAVRAHQLEQARVDGGPDRAPLPGSRPTPLARTSPVRRPRPRPGCAMSSTGTSTARSKALRAPASTIATGRGFHVRVPSPPPR